MFLNEVALGKIKEITRNESSLTAAPKGFDSVLAKGNQEPGYLIHSIIVTLLAIFLFHLKIVQMYSA